MKIHTIKDLETGLFIGERGFVMDEEDARFFRRNLEDFAPIVCDETLIDLEKCEILTYNLVKE
jgi:hypothetical protein